MKPHWSTPLLGKPWSIDGRGPDVFSCWGLVHWVYARRLGIALPDYPGVESLPSVTRCMREAEATGDWHRLLRPLDGCLAGMSHGTSLHHVGVYVGADRGMILHSAEGRGVVCEPLESLPSRGWSRVDYYIHKQWPIS